VQSGSRDDYRLPLRIQRVGRLSMNRYSAAKLRLTIVRADP
jgi:hypothetical protein